MAIQEMRVSGWIWEALPFAAMITVECTDVGVSTISKAALANGMSKFVSVAYYNALATLLLLPYFIFHRKKTDPLTFSLLWRFFLIALVGSVGQVLYLSAIKLSSPNLSSAMANLCPVFTFILAVITRMEALNLRKPASQAKSVGAIVAVTGALIVTLYKGPAILGTSSVSNFSHSQFLFSKQSDWILGGFLLAFTMFLSATWNIVQGATVKEYPEEMTIVFFFTLFITIQSAVFALILEKDPNAWKLKPGIEMIAIAYTAIFGSVMRIGIHTWCLRKKGPVYVAMFKPLGIVVALFMTLMFLGETLHLGSAIGSIIISVGFYGVIWGQNKERTVALEKEVCRPESSTQRTPLLQKSGHEEA